MNGDSIYNGAHDNAVGIAMLLEMARALHVSNTKPRRSMLFAAVTAEEKGLLGSDYFAAAARAATAERIVANVNIDMPMPFVPVRDFVALGAEHSSLGALARNAAAAQGYRLSPDAAPEEVRLHPQRPVLVHSPRHPGARAERRLQARATRASTAAALQRQFRETHYHQPSDDLNLPLDYATAADLARIDLRIVLDAANGASAPRWNARRFLCGEVRRLPVESRGSGGAGRQGEAAMKDLSTDELAELRESFDTCDSNGDGWIIVGEFAALLSRSIRI